MPLPLASCADDVPTDVCCSSVWDVAERLRCVAFEALCGCFEGGCADEEFRSYVSIGQTVPEPLGDALVVHISGDIAPTQNSQTGRGNLLGISVQQARFEIFLTENGWPQIHVNELGEVINTPPSDLINAVARHSYSHGEKMYRAIVNGVAKQTLFPIPAFQHLHKVQVVGLRPVQPAAFTVGWRIPVNVQMTLP